MEGTLVADRYELRAKLGAGTAAAVYLARDQRLGRDVALKLLHEIPHEAARRRFEREARIASAFRHPDVIEVYDVGEHEGRPFLVMELVTAPSLATALAGEGEAPTVAAAAAIGGRLAELLAAAHEAGLVHRDVKPANVFLDGTIAAPERCRLSDFGLAFMSVAGASELGRFTMEGVMLGTPLYMAPEQAEGRQVGPPADVYSLGCMIHEMVARRPPFVGNIARVLAGHMYLPPVPLRELTGGVPPELEALVLELLAKEPDRRPTARDAARRLAALGATPDVVDAAPGAAPGAARARSTTLEPRSVRAISAAAVVLPEGAEPPPVVALEVDDPALAAALREHAIEIADDAPLALGPLDAPPGSRPRLAVHPDPTPAVLLRAIRAGAAGVVRWPGPADAAVAQIRLAWRSIHRLP